MDDLKKNLPGLWPHVLNSSPNGIMLLDDKGEILYSNNGARLIFDRSVGIKNFVGRHISEIREDSWQALKVMFKTGKPQLKHKLKLGDATIIANRCPVKIGDQLLGALLVFHDISEYETLISELKGYTRLNTELEAIFESSFDGLYITDGQAKTIRVNSAYEKITGLAKQNLIGRDMHSLIKERIFDHSVTLQVLEKKEPITIMQKIRGEKQVIVSGTPVFDETGEILLVVTNVRDITKLNTLRSQLEKSRRINSGFYQSLQEHDGIEHALDKMVVKSQAMIQIVKKAIKVARAQTSILLLGESGVGKSMLAGIIHNMSPRKEGPFIKINCGAIPQSLMESELFGYEKGAFTGALSTGKAGLIELAHTGTVFLDEVGELKPDMQVKILEAIEDKTFKKIGAHCATKIDVNIIAATNRDLKTMIQQGHFREDLYYRLNVVPIAIPPLRERREDIPPLVINVIEKFNKQKKLKKSIEHETLDLLSRYHFPGNVRELVNIIERMIVLSDNNQIRPEDLPSMIRDQQSNHQDISLAKGSLKEIITDVETRVIRDRLSKLGSVSKTARELNLHPTTLWRKMTKYGIKDIASMQDIAETQ